MLAGAKAVLLAFISGQEGEEEAGSVLSSLQVCTPVPNCALFPICLSVGDLCSSWSLREPPCPVAFSSPEFDLSSSASLL